MKYPIGTSAFHAVHHKFRVLFCTVVKSTYKKVILGSLKLPGVLKSNISWKIRTFSIKQAVFFVGECSSIFR